MNTAKIIDAIVEKKTITFEYDGQSRTVEPHHSGILGNSQQIHGYQIKGGSKSGKIPEWRNFEMKKIKNLSKNDEIFAPQLSYNPSNSHYKKIDRQVK